MLGPLAPQDLEVTDLVHDSLQPSTSHPLLEWRSLALRALFRSRKLSARAGGSGCAGLAIWVARSLVAVAAHARDGPVRARDLGDNGVTESAPQANPCGGDQD